MKTRKHLWFIAALTALGCSGADPESKSEPEPGPPTPECVTGVWSSQDLPCQCPPPDSGLGTSECEAPICQQATTYVFDGDGTFYEALVQRTTTTFSAFGNALAVRQGTWTIEEGTHLVTITPLLDGAEKRWDTKATCSATQLRRGGATAFVKPAPRLAEAIQDAAHTGVWTNHPYAP